MGFLKHNWKSWGLRSLVFENVNDEIWCWTHQMSFLKPRDCSDGFKVFFWAFASSGYIGECSPNFEMTFYTKQIEEFLMEWMCIWGILLFPGKQFNIFFVFQRHL
jgi:hypothetical protein